MRRCVCEKSLRRGRPGPLTSIGLGLNDARRPFRLYKPIESMLPILKGPKGKGILKTLEYVKAFSMAVRNGEGGKREGEGDWG